jgi:ribonuclease P protein component
LPLNKKNKINRPSEFDIVFKGGKAVKGSFLFIKFISRFDDQKRFGIIVSAGVSKKAVIRNKIKRTLTEFLRKNMSKIKEGKDTVIVLKNNLQKFDANSLTDDLAGVLITAGLTKE